MTPSRDTDEKEYNIIYKGRGCVVYELDSRTNGHLVQGA